MNRKWARTIRSVWACVATLTLAACSGATATDADTSATAEEDTGAFSFADAVDTSGGADAEDVAADESTGTDAAPTEDAQKDSAPDAPADGAADVATADVSDVGPCYPNACPQSDSPCVTAVCQPNGSCGFAVTTGNACTDDNACTLKDTCQDGTCIGSAINCDDGNACTLDSCKGASGCVHAFEFGPCEDGNGCTVNDQCVSGDCIAGGALVCTPSDPCQEAGTCEPATGICPFGALPNGTVCGASQVCMVGKCEVADALPVGALAWFDTANCPAGWLAEPQAVGRTIVPGDSTTAGQADGTPLAPGEDRKHTHDVKGSVSTSAVSFVGIASCCNAGLATSGTWDATGSALAASSGVPYVELLACRKSAGILVGDAPAGLVAFPGGLNCPAGWSAPATGLDRFVVATPNGGTTGATFGGTWAKPHSHGVKGDIILAAHGIGLASGCCGGGYAAAGNVGFSATSSDATATFPSLHSLACVASGGSNTGPIPSGLISYFTTATCPSGWSAATSVSGRLVVGVANGADVGVTVGSALTDQEDRTHAHDVLLSVQPPVKSIAGSDGGNGQATGNTTAESTVPSGKSTSGMPFVQWLACRKN